MLLLAGEHALTNKEVGYRSVVWSTLLFLCSVDAAQPFKPILFAAVDPLQH